MSDVFDHVPSDGLFLLVAKDPFRSAIPLHDPERRIGNYTSHGHAVELQLESFQQQRTLRLQLFVQQCEFLPTITYGNNTDRKSYVSRDLFQEVDLIAVKEAGMADVQAQYSPHRTVNDQRERSDRLNSCTVGAFPPRRVYGLRWNEIILNN